MLAVDMRDLSIDGLPVRNRVNVGPLIGISGIVRRAIQQMRGQEHAEGPRFVRGL